LTETTLSVPLEPSVETQQVEEDVSIGPSVVIHPSVGTSLDSPVQSFEWRMFLRMGNREMVLDHEDFL